MSDVELPVWYGTTPPQRAAGIWDYLKVLTIEPPGGSTASPLPKPPGRLTIMPSAKPRRRRKPTLKTVAKQVAKANIEVKRYEVKPDGTVVIVPGKPEPDSDNDSVNPWDKVLDDHGTH